MRGGSTSGFRDPPHSSLPPALHHLLSEQSQPSHPFPFPSSPQAQASGAGSTASANAFASAVIEGFRGACNQCPAQTASAVASE